MPKLFKCARTAALATTGSILVFGYKLHNYNSASERAWRLYQEDSQRYTTYPLLKSKEEFIQSKELEYYLNELKGLPCGYVGTKPVYSTRNSNKG